MHIRLSRGLDIRLSGAPDCSRIERPLASGVGLSGLDYPGLRPEFLVEQGQRVAAGDPLLRDRRRPLITVAAPVAGTVAQLTRRDPSTGSFFVIIGNDGNDGSETPPAPVFDVPRNWRSSGAVRDVLLAGGLWAALLERPYGVLPDPHAVPDAILVTAMAADPLSPDPRAVVAGRETDFAAGCEALSYLTDGPVHVCQGPGATLATGAVTFSGAYPAGLAGTHVHHLCPVVNGRRIWTVNYQDVIAIGRLLSTGQLETERVISLAGPGVRAPGLLQVPLGAEIAELAHGRLRDGAYRILSGPCLSGREAQYLGRSHLQVSVLPAARGFGRRGLFARARRTGPIIPIAAHQGAFPFDLPAVPLLRALAVGDSETAAALGCVELLEEDVAVLSHVCPSGNAYGPMLRAVLDDLRRDS